MLEARIAQLRGRTLEQAAGFELGQVPVTNPLAYAHQRRGGDRNLNRGLGPTEAPLEYEDHVANWLCPLLARHDVLLDLHSFLAPGTPFVMLGPPDNRGTLEPFAHAHREEALAARLGVRRAMDGWLGVYARGVARRRERAGAAGGPTAHIAEHYGVGTTEYMRSVGGWALTLECGQHDDPHAPSVAHRAIVRTLAHLGLIDEAEPAPEPDMEGLRLCEVVDKLHLDDAFAKPWTSFDPVAAGERIGSRHDGSPVEAPFDGHIVFPNPTAAPGSEWFYLARRHPRLGRG